MVKEPGRYRGIIQLGASLGLLGVVGVSQPLVLLGLALIFVTILAIMKHLLLNDINSRGGPKMKKKTKIHNTKLVTSLFEATYDFLASFGAGYLGGTIPSIVPPRDWTRRQVTKAIIL